MNFPNEVFHEGKILTELTKIRILIRPFPFIFTLISPLSKVFTVKIIHSYSRESLTHGIFLVLEPY